MLEWTREGRAMEWGQVGRQQALPAVQGARYRVVEKVRTRMAGTQNLKNKKLVIARYDV